MSPQPVKSAERTIKVLELFQRQQQPQTLHQVATQLRMPVPSTLAILRTLVGMGYLILDVRRKTYFPALRLASLGDASFERVEVAPFGIERFGLEFGLVARAPEDEDDEWAVEMQPGNYMAFFEPWDSGEYDT